MGRLEAELAKACGVFSEHMANIASRDLVADVLPAWKRAWRQARPEAAQRQREQASMEHEDALQAQRRRAGRREKQVREKQEQQELQKQQQPQKHSLKRGGQGAGKQPIKKPKRPAKQAGAQQSKQATKAGSNPTSTAPDGHHKQPAGSEHCWRCRGDIPVAEYNYCTDSCANPTACQERAAKNVDKRQRKKRT